MAMVLLGLFRERQEMTTGKQLAFEVLRIDRGEWPGVLAGRPEHG
jgi:hypothetical protein